MGRKAPNPPPPNWPHGIAIQEHIGLLGHKVVDKVSGFKGVVDSISFDLYGCIQAGVTPSATDGKKIENSRWFDVTRLKIASKKPVMRLPNFDFGYVAEGKKGAADKAPR